MPRTTTDGTYRLSGPVSIAYRYDKNAKEWEAIALQFNILGLGKTKEEAFQEVKSLFETYVETITQTKGKVQFHNPAEGRYWDAEDVDQFHVVVSFDAEAPCQLIDVGRIPTIDIKGIRRRHKQPERVDLVLA